MRLRKVGTAIKIQSRLKPTTKKQQQQKPTQTAGAARVYTTAKESYTESRICTGLLVACGAAPFWWPTTVNLKYSTKL